MRGAIVLFLLLTAACGAGREAESGPSADSSRPWARPGDVIDSILPMAEYQRRFREGLVEVTALDGGAESPEALARRFLEAVGARDTAALRRMALTRAEFAWLLFPDHRYSEPPYELDPAIFWLQLTAESGKGLERVLQRYGGAALTFQRLECSTDTLQLLRGPTSLLGPCTVRYRTTDSTITRRLFGSVIARDGRVKFVSYANEF